MRVTSILGPGEAEGMVELADSLGFEFVDVEYEVDKVDEKSNVDDMRRYLEDTFSLLETVEKPEVDFDKIDDRDDDDNSDGDDDNEE